MPLALDTLLKAQLVEHEALKKAGTTCPFVFHRHGRKIVDFYDAWRTACRAKPRCP